jgi:hypothetical protein
VSVKLDEEFLTLNEATGLAGALATTAAKTAADDTTIVQTMDLPPGKDYLVLDDVGVVALSSHLDEQGRQRVLPCLGLR